MVRRAVSLAASLLMAAALSVGLAWGAALWSPLGPERTSESDFVRAGYWPRTVHMSVASGFGIEYRAETHADLKKRREGIWEGPVMVSAPMYSCRAGWPFACLSADGRTEGWTVPIRWRLPDPVWTGYNASAPALGQLPHTRSIPRRVEWAGMVANVSIFGLAPWLAWHLWTAARWRLRIVRGRCGRCGYEVGGLSTCPECGTSLVRR
jgi:hypothetical protein